MPICLCHTGHRHGPCQRFNLGAQPACAHSRRAGSTDELNHALQGVASHLYQIQLALCLRQVIFQELPLLACRTFQFLAQTVDLSLKFLRLGIEFRGELAQGLIARGSWILIV